MKGEQQYGSYRHRRRYKPEGDGQKPRQTIGSILRDRIFRYLTIPFFLLSMLFFLVPSLMVVLEMIGKVALVSEPLLVMGILFGSLLVLLLLGRALFFRYRDLWFQSYFTAFFFLLFGSMTIGSIWDKEAVSLGELFRQYQIDAQTISAMFEQDYRIPEVESPRSDDLTPAEELVQTLTYDILVAEYANYGLHKYYVDAYSDDSGSEVFKVLSMYRVVLEEFGIFKNPAGSDPDIDPAALFADMEGEQFEVTVLMNACLYQLTTAADVTVHRDDVWRVEWLAYPEEYTQMKEILSGSEWPYPHVTWYINEFTVNYSADEYFLVPLYLPVHNVDGDDSD